MTDREWKLRDRVYAELSSGLCLNVPEIDVTVSNGVATLTGFVDGYEQEQLAEQAAMRVEDVAVVADELNVTETDPRERLDSEIATNIAQYLRAPVNNGWHRVKACVHNGCVMLQGEVELLYDKAAVQRAVAETRGVTWVTNDIEVSPPTSPADLEKKIEKMLSQLLHVDTGQVSVETNGGTARLRGHVSSALRNQIHQALLFASGVTEIVDELEVVACLSPGKENAE